MRRLSPRAQQTPNAELRERLQLLQLALDGAGDAISISHLDPPATDRFIYVNDSLCRLTGYERDELLDRSLTLLCSGPEASRVIADLLNAAAAGRPYRCEFLAHRKDGAAYYQETSSTPLRREGRVTHFVAISRDVTDRRQEQDMLAHQALHDALTDLPNRILLGDRLHQAILAATRDQRELAVMIVDLDGFKEVNDTHGHSAGDAVLRELGVRLQRILRESDTVARIGGDEFALVLPASGGPREVLAIGAKMLAAIRRPFHLSPNRVYISASIGAALFPAHGSDAQALLDRADQAMYSAKRGRLGCAIYEP